MEKIMDEQRITNGGKNVQISEEAHDMARELAFYERRTIRSVLEEAIQTLKDSRSKK